MKPTTPRKRLNKTEKKTHELLEEFEAAALDWGWTQDQGVGSHVDSSKLAFESAKNKLYLHINRLHNKLREKPKVIELY